MDGLALLDVVPAVPRPVSITAHDGLVYVLGGGMEPGIAGLRFAGETLEPPAMQAHRPRRQGHPRRGALGRRPHALRARRRRAEVFGRRIEAGAALEPVGAVDGLPATAAGPAAL